MMIDKPGHILVVDDHKMNRLKISMAVKKLGHSTDVAEDGGQALIALRATPFDLVLLDINMPHVDGYQVLTEMKSDPLLRDIPVIVISAQEEFENIVKAIELGAEDHLPKAFDPVLLKARISACLEKKRLRDKQAATLAQLDTENQRKSEELEQARQIQRSMLPATTPTLPYLDIAAWQETASEVGGDYYDFFAQAEGKHLLVLGDATGHGVSSALMVSMTKALLLAHNGHDINTLMSKLNTILYKLGFGKQLNMALQLLEVEPTDDGRVIVTAIGGGSCPIYVLRANGTVAEIIVSGLPLGIVAEAMYQPTRFELAPGEAMILMSDGVIERFNAAGEFLGYPRLCEELAQIDPTPQTAEAILRHIIHFGDTWAADHPMHDDVTVVVTKAR